jgi:hypothetical protein
MREDERDRLRMLGKNELRELLRVRLLEGREHERRLERLHEPIEQPFGHLWTERLHEQLLRVVHAASRHVLRRDPHVVELFENLFAGRRAHAAEHRHFPGDLLDLVLLQVLEHLGRGVLSEQEREHRGLADAVHRR